LQPRRLKPTTQHRHLKIFCENWWWIGGRAIGLLIVQQPSTRILTGSKSAPKFLMIVEIYDDFEEDFERLGFESATKLAVIMASPRRINCRLKM
jgi:hypothetical protein